MTDTATNKHFLDSSVARPMLVGSRAYKQYFEDQFGDDNRYISNYVQMEMKRSFFAPIIDFYFVLDMPNIRTIGDACKVWSNQFKGSDKTAILQLVGDLLDTRQLNISNPRHKKRALRAIGDYVKRLEGQLRRKFLNIGTDATRCTRSKVPFTSTQHNLMLSEQLRHFKEQFDDKKTCRNKCRVDHFILERYLAEIKDYIEHAASLVRPKSKENKGFVKIVDNLAKILEKGPESCSCRMCGNIGDAIIALESPPDMRIEHTDHSFDNLCKVINKPHYKHPAEISFINSM